ncbi:MAG: alpha/beta hydrolase [Burkholderiales bacterium]|nr:alpha/beta hydrolase [Burkholderiales bacterium]
MAMLPSRVSDLADVDLIERAACRHEIAGAAGPMVWRSWGAGDPVVLLHGGSGSWNHWVRNIAALVAAGRQVWIPDLPGFGESARVPSGGDADALPEPMHDALQVLLGDAAVDMVGFSFGTMVAVLMAARWPQRIRRLVLSGAPALGVKSEEKLELRAWSHLAPGPALDAVLRQNLAALMLARPQSLDELALALHAANLPRDRMRLRRLSKTNLIRDTLPAVQCPVHGVWGREDALYLGVQDQLAPALALAPGFQGLTLIAQAGHWVQYEDAQAYDQALAAALSG